ncbi:hypothetical protein V6S02_05980 [Microbacterium sp. CCNWLW134]|uniref:hypothetical protein n=1 Tax=Microbacterium sp. CCNWLW134 TaxID=3122064 RepID=UPI0030103DC7
MSMLIFSQTEENLILWTDTLVVDTDHRPTGLAQKAWALPDINVLVAATGTAEIALSFVENLNRASGLTDIEDVNGRATGVLQAIHDTLEAHVGNIGRSTIYVWGFPADGGKLVRYIYRSMNNYQPERYVGDQFGAKPSPPGRELEMPSSHEDVIELALQLQQINRDSEHGVPSGGELIATYLQRGDVRTQLIFQFPDLEESLKAIKERE